MTAFRISLPQLVLAGAAGLCLGLLLAWSHSGSFLNHDEITYLHMARHMIATGNGLDLVFQGAVVHQRPPLAIWLLAGAGGIGGFDSHFALRLPAMLMAAACLLFLYFLVKELHASRRAALLAVFLLLASQLFYFNARRPMTDTTFLAGALAFLYFTVRAHRDPRFLLAAGAAAGWMAMAKGVVASLPLAVAAADLLLARRFELLRTRWFAAGAALFAALLLPWHLAQWARWGNAFWAEYIGFNVFQRSANSLFARPDPLFYLRELWAGEGALLLIFLAGAAAVAVRFARRRHRADRFWLLYLVLVAGPLQLSATRIAHYFLPVLPALAACAAAAVTPWLRRPTLYAAALATALALFFVHNTGHLLHPDYSPDQHRFARHFRQHAQPEDRLVALNHYELALFWYAHRPVRMLTDSPAFFAAVDSAPILHRSNAVQLLSRKELATWLHAESWWAITRPDQADRLPAATSLRGREFVFSTSRSYPPSE